MVRVAMIGAGSMANRVHYPSLASFDDVEFAGVCDLDEKLLAATADRYGIERRYTDYRRMIEEAAPDGVYAIGQPNIMFDIWIWCLQQGLNLYIEKPMGMSRHQAIVLADLAAKRGVITQVNHQRRSAAILGEWRSTAWRGCLVAATQRSGGEGARQAGPADARSGFRVGIGAASRCRRGQGA